MSLTDKQAAFVEEYLKDFNATRAAERAGYSGSYNTLGAIGCENLKKPKIAEAISARMEELVMDANEVLVRLSEIAKGEWARYIDENGEVQIDKMVADRKAHLITKISDTKYGRRYEFCDMLSALKDVAKIHSLFVDRTQNLNVDMSSLTTEQLERIANGEDPIHVLATSGTSGA